MKLNRSFRPNRGFTLIEVAVALTILGWVLASAVTLVKQYADERIGMRERFLASQVAWNQLMEEQRIARGMRSINDATARDDNGEETQAGQVWQWQRNIEEAAGEDLYQYKVSVGLADSERISASYSVYLVHSEGEP